MNQLDAPANDHSPTRNLTSQLPLRRALLLVALACFALPQSARAVTPAPDGGYPNGNTAEGTDALFSLTTGADNTASGFQALFDNTTGGSNTASGAFALLRNINGINNTASGFSALYSNTTGFYNTASGYQALASNTTGSYNTASGFQALRLNGTSYYNTATGSLALHSNQGGGVNVANGYSALEANVSGFYNVAAGGFALGTNINGSYNAAVGANALYYNKGNNNTANGHQALQNNTSGGNNVAVGYQAGNNLTTGSNNIVIGAGVLGKAGEANTTRIGKTTQAATYIGGIYNKTVASASGVAVRIDSTGKLGTVLSSARYKKAIKPMDKASEALLALEPVTFRYKEELDPDGLPQFGLIAEQVEKVDPNLVVRDEDGKVSTVRYEAVNAMLLNEFLKERRKVEEQGDRFARQQKEFESKLSQQQKNFESKFAQQQKQMEALTATIQKVSHEIELSKPAPQTAANDD